MATIVFRTGKNRPWLAQIRRKGHRVFSKSFVRKGDAQRWAAEQERAIDIHGLPLTVEELKKTTIGDLVDRYLVEVTPFKETASNERLTLEKFKRNAMCQKTLAFLSTADGEAYYAERLNDTWKPKGSKGLAKPLKPSSIRREISTLSNIFEVAKRKWRLGNLINPFAGLKVRARKINGVIYTTTHRRTRRLNEGEQVLLEAACAGCLGDNRFFVLLAILLAIETAMRRQEIFNLRWGDVDTKTRRIKIQKSKTDHVADNPGREIVMTKRAIFLFVAAMPPQTVNNKPDPEQTVFPMSKRAFSEAWKDVLRRAGIKGLTFHDLRREAGSRFDEAGLTKAEHDLMMGHSNGDVGSIYIASKLKLIQSKLDNYENETSSRERK
jgi:integrase